MQSSDTPSAPSLRIDKWLWAARFFKTRSLAATAIQAGHVRRNGQSLKPAHDVKLGDSLEITIGSTQLTIIVRGLNPLRRPASEAQLLYEETAESLEKRVSARELLRLAPAPGSDRGERPTKKARRQIHRFNAGY